MRSDTMIRSYFQARANRPELVCDDQRGKKRLRRKVVSQTIQKHFNGFHTRPSHYRYAHAPRRRYLPRANTVRSLWQNLKFQGFNAYYSAYQKSLTENHISFAQRLPDICETYQQAKTNQLDGVHALGQCDICKKNIANHKGNAA